MKNSGRPKPLPRRPLPRRGEAPKFDSPEKSVQNGDDETLTEKKGILIARKDGTVTEIKNEVEMWVQSSAFSTSTIDSSAKLCRMCGIHHCFVCDKCMSGLEPYQMHMKSDRHMKKVRDKLLLEGAAKERERRRELAAEEERKKLVEAERKAELERLPAWRKLAKADCPQPGCIFHCDVCDVHLAGAVFAEEHFESLEHLRTVDKSRLGYNEANQGKRSSDTFENDVNTGHEPSDECRTVENVDNVGRTSLFSERVKTNEFNRKVEVFSSFSDGIVYRSLEEEVEHENDLLEFEETKFLQSDIESQLLEEECEAISIRPFTDLMRKKQEGTSASLYGPVCNTKPKSTTSDDARSEGSSFEILTVDTKKVEDLSIYDDENILYDISQEPEAVPKIVGKKAEKTDYEWFERGIQTDLNRCEKSDPKILEEEKHNKESEERWNKFFVEQQKNRPVRQVMNTSAISRLQPVTVVMNDRSKPLSSETVIHSNCQYLGCLYHCNACDVHLSGVESKVQHEASAVHRKIMENRQRLQEEKCSYPGCVYHCVVCDLHLSGLEPRDQHLQSAKHIKRAKARGVEVNSAPSSPRSQSSTGSDYVSNLSPKCLNSNEKILEEESSERFFLERESKPSDVMNISAFRRLQRVAVVTNDRSKPLPNETAIHSNCTHLGCLYHCSACDAHLSGIEPKMQHEASAVHRKIMENRQRLPEEKCSYPGCVYHCVVCDLHLSGLEPRDQHLLSAKHIKRAKARGVEVNSAPRSQSSIGSDNVSALSPKCLNSYEKSDSKILEEKRNEECEEGWERFFLKQENDRSEPLPDETVIHSNCTHLGCLYHCSACDAHLSGVEPKMQHEASAVHRKIMENCQRLQEEKCSYPGCRYHCVVCDLHLSGLEPRDQHLLSAKHIKRAKARGVEVNSAPRPQSATGSGSVSTLDPKCLEVTQTLAVSASSMPGASASCGLSFCYYHCYVCNIHLSDEASRHQHFQSGKHIKRPVSFQSSPYWRPATTPEILKAFVMAQEEGVSVDVECFIQCPDDNNGCLFHCDICNKHLSGIHPKNQHERSANHMKNVMAFVNGGKKVAVDTADGIVDGASASKKGKDFKLPDRRNCPFVKCCAENDMDNEFHTKDTPRDYQIEMFYKARDHDAVCYLPTGTGKTLVSAMLIDFMLEKNPEKPVLFMVDKVLLVLQQSKYLKEQIGEHEYYRYGKKRRCNIAALYSGKTDLDGSRLEDVDVVVGTAGVIDNLLSSKRIRWLDFCLVAIDEVHHCEKDHLFKRLIKNYHDENPRDQRPKLFGMTASPAGEMTDIAAVTRLRNLLRAVGNAKLCQVENCREILDEHRSRTEIEIVYVALSESEKLLGKSLQKHLLMCYRFLMKNSNIQKLDLNIVISTERPDEHNELEFAGDNLVNLRECLSFVTAKPGWQGSVENVLEHVYDICSALMGLNICGDIAAYNILRDLLDSVAKSFKSMNDLGLLCDYLSGVVKRNCDVLNMKGYVLAAIERGQNMTAYDKLMHIILTKVDWDSRSQGKQPIVLILVDERKVAQFLTEILIMTDCLISRNIKTAALVGHGVKGSGGGMTVPQQKRVLAGICDYMYQIVVATSVAEEGLDLPNCDVVIALVPPKGITSLVQIRGRARQKHSHLFAICRNESDELQMNRLLRNEKCMYRAIDKICRDQDEGMELGSAVE